MKANICGLKIREFRKEQNMGQVDLAEAIKLEHDILLTQSDISEIERGIRGVKDFELNAFALVFNVNVGDLLS